MRLAIYPGTFDPVTKGHLDVLARACRMFDAVIVAVAPNIGKGPLFNLEERIALIKPNLVDYPRASIQPLDGLTVDFARSKGAVAIIRGLRAISDFEYEFQLAQMNRHLDDSIETIFLMPSQDHFYTSSKLVKQVSLLDTRRLDKFVPANVLDALRQRPGIPEESA